MSVRRLLLVRHGLPDYAARKCGDEPPGPPLSELGRVQIRQLIPLFSNMSIDRLYCYSPLARARHSAEIIARALSPRPGRQFGSEGVAIAPSGSMKLTSVARAGFAAGFAAEIRARWFSDTASPLLSIIRSALYLPQFPWWHAGDSSRLVLNTCDRFEVSMGSLFELEFARDRVTAKCLHHPEPRMVHKVRGRRPLRSFLRPVQTVESTEFVRPDYTALIGFRPAE